MKIKSRKFLVADFETSTEEWLEKDNGIARVWVWGLYDVETDGFEYGLDIDSFMKNILVRKKVNPIIYFHNLKYDGSYIVNYLLREGYKYDEDLSKENTFRTSISDMGQWYFIEVCIYRNKKMSYTIRIQDSLKKIPMPLKDIPETFGFDEEKGDLDYDRYRPVGYIPNDNELYYLLRDCMIPAKALKILEEEGFTKMTLSGDSFHAWKLSLMTKQARDRHIQPETNFRRFFPALTVEQDDYIRKAYRGGWTYVNPKYQNKMLNNLLVYDINSMYPDKLRNEYLPMGQPTFFKGEPHPTKFQCYIVRVMIDFEIKPNHLPSIQVKNSYVFNPTDYLLSSNGNKIELYLTNWDLRMIFRQYKVLSIEYLDGYYFRKVKGFFNEHIDNNMEIKEHSIGGRRFLAKRRMNSVYGKTATSPRLKKKIPYLKDGVLKFTLSNETIEEPQYTAIGVFTTSIARFKIIGDAQNNIDSFVYCDTDSLHLLDEGKEPNLPIHDTHLGCYKLESKPHRALFLRSKTYIEEITNKKGELECEIKCAGANEFVKSKMSFENFKIGETYEGRLLPKQVKGGCVLHKTTFTLK